MARDHDLKLTPLITLKNFINSLLTYKRGAAGIYAIIMPL